MKRLLLATLLLPAIPAAAWADTLADALVAAHHSNPTLEEARLAVRAAHEDRVQARAAYMPSLDVSATAGTQDTETNLGPIHQDVELNPSSAGVRLTQQLYTGGRRDGQTRLARASVDSANQGLRATEQNVLLAAVQAYVNLQRDEQVVELREQHVQGLMEQLNGTRRRLQVGEVSRTDVAQAETRLAGARAALAQARSDVEGSRARYIEIVGVAPQDLAPAPAPALPETLDFAMRQAEANHPELLQSQSGERAARARVTIERSALLPQVSVTGRYDEFDSRQIQDAREDQTSAVAQFSVPLFEGGYAWSRTHQSQINVQRAIARTEAQRRQVMSGVVTAWNEVTAGRAVVDAAHEQEDASQSALSGVERERGLGLRSTLDVLNAEEEWLNARIAVARAEADSTFAGYNLLAATGALSLEGLGIRD